MDNKLKEEILIFLVNFRHTMNAYRHSITSHQYIDPASHMANIEKMNSLAAQLKEKVEKS